MRMITTMPCAGAREEPGEGGFVDEAVVRRVAAGPRWARIRPMMPLDEDFAGWGLSGVEDPVADGPAVLADKSANHGEGEWGMVDRTHHWWMAGLAGATLAVVVLMTAFSLGFESGTLKEQFRQSLPWSNDESALTSNDLRRNGGGQSYEIR